MEKPSVIIAEVEDFLKKWNKELVFTPDAKTLSFEFDDGKNFWGRPKKHLVNFPNEIGQAIAEYKWERDLGNPILVFRSAYRLLAMIQKAYVYGVIKDIKQQTHDYEQEIRQLREEVDRLTILNEKLTVENNALHKLFPNKRKGKTEVGDVANF